MESRPGGTDLRFADIDPAKLKEYQKVILNIEPVKPPTFAENLRAKLSNFWNKYDIFVYIGLAGVGAGIGAALGWRIPESEEVRRFVGQAAFASMGAIVGGVLIGSITFITGNIIHDMVQNSRRRQ